MTSSLTDCNSRTVRTFFIYESQYAQRDKRGYEQNGTLTRSIAQIIFAQAQSAPQARSTVRRSCSYLESNGVIEKLWPVLQITRNTFTLILAYRTPLSVINSALRSAQANDATPIQVLTQ